MFKESKISHTTLQRALSELIKKKFIKKYDLGHQNVDYGISDKGKELLRLLSELRQFL